MVEGHTDNVPVGGGQYRSNWDLSAARAVSVVQLLVAGGIAPERLSAVGYGEFHPAVPNLTPDGRNANRRVVLSVQAVVAAPAPVACCTCQMPMRPHLLLLRRPRHPRSDRPSRRDGVIGSNMSRHEAVAWILLLSEQCARVTDASAKGNPDHFEYVSHDMPYLQDDWILFAARTALLAVTLAVLRAGLSPAGVAPAAATCRR